MIATTRPVREDLFQLRSVPWLRALPASDLAELQRSVQHQRFAGGETIFSPSASPRSIHLLESGLARTYRLSETGAEIGFGYVAPGETFGDLPAFGDLPRECFAQAVRPCGVWKLAREPFQQLLAQHPSVALAVAEQLAARLSRVEARLEDLAFRPVRARVARVLAELAQRFGRRDAERVVLDMPITQGELATLVGATRQTVNQSLGELTADGLIGRERHRLVLLDMRRLAGAGAAPQGAQ
jgi:CRP-like cAMP-binding protein